MNLVSHSWKIYKLNKTTYLIIDSWAQPFKIIDENAYSDWYYNLHDAIKKCKVDNGYKTLAHYEYINSFFKENNI